MTRGNLMQITIYYFAYLREKRGMNTEHRTISSPISVKQLFQDIFDISPQAIRFSINQEFVDEVAFVPPVGGG